MELRDFLGMLQGVKRSGSGYIARCPCHDDRKASLAVAQGDNGGIVIKCMAGCETQDIVKSMGLKMSDLFAPKTEYQPKRKPTPQAKPKIVAAYQYTDERGELLFEVLRYEPKNFRQRQWDKLDGGWKWSVKGVRPVVYKLPQVLAAIKAGKPVYVVEGEKDADNLEKLGFTATTSAAGAGKWKQEHSEQLRGGKVYILPDNDEPGSKHAQQVAQSLQGIAAEVYVIDLSKGCTSLPPKGDVTDFFHLLGKEHGLEVFYQLVDQAKPWTPEQLQRAQEDPGDERVTLYKNVTGYGVQDGYTVQYMADGQVKRLATFVAAVRENITKDDGVTTESVLVIDGWDEDGYKLPKISVTASKFSALNWTFENWGCAASILPGNATRDNLRYAIAREGKMHATRRTVYTHTGWRKIRGQWAYLYCGGAIGVDGVSVELEGRLKDYDMHCTLEALPDVKEANDWAFTWPQILQPRVAVPLQSLMFLAPLREFLAARGMAPAFTLYLQGLTGTRKSTAAALALSHFGRFTGKNMPASFNDTANSVGRSAFILKDMPLLIDDYHPEGNAQARRQMENTAQSIVRAYGDGAARGRLNADLTFASSMPPRSVGLMTGEDVPNIGESGLARFYVVQVNEGDIPLGEGLVKLQELAAKGYFARAMRGYIEWLIPQADLLPAQLEKRFIELRAEASMGSKAAHARVPEAMAHLMLGYEMMLKYMLNQGVIEEDDVEAFMQDGWKHIRANSAEQGKDIRDERPSRMFLNAISEMLSSSRVTVVDLSDAQQRGSGPNMIGYQDARYYYLLPDLAYAATARLVNDQGGSFPLSKKALLKQLLADHALIPDGSGGATRLKRIGSGGTAKRMLWIPREKIDGGVEPKQVTVDDLLEASVIIEHDDKNPFKE